MKNRRRYTYTQRILRRRRMSATAFFLALVFMLPAGVHFVQAKDRYYEMQENVQYASIRIERNDTLWSIAQQYAPEHQNKMDYIQELKKLNHLQDDTIQSGRYLIVSIR